MGSGGVNLDIFNSIFFQVSDTYRITSVMKVETDITVGISASVMKVETDIIVSISASPIGKAVILVVMYVRTYKIQLMILFLSAMT